MLNRRGQIFTVDLILASVVFLMILTLSITYSMEIANRINLLEEESARQDAARNAANALLFSTGSPANWQNLDNLSGVSSLGLADTMNVIDAEKLRHLLDLNAGYYNEIRSLLGVGKYGLRISVLDLQSKQSLADFGLEPADDEKVTSVNRIASYNGAEVIVQVRVFEG